MSEQVASSADEYEQVSLNENESSLNNISLNSDGTGESKAMSVLKAIKPAIPIYLLTAAEGFNEYSVLSYLGYMVRDLKADLEGDKDDLSAVGYYAGLLGAAIFFGTALTSYVWGRGADYFGRRPILLMGAFTEIFCILLFGFSQNYWWAVASRFVGGLLNGNLGVTKTFLAETSNSKTQAALFTGWTLAEVITGIVGAMYAHWG